MHIAPLDQRRRGSGERAVAIRAHADAPAQQALRRHPLGRLQLTAVDAGGAHRKQRCADVVAPRDPVNELRAVGRERALQRGVVEVEPACVPRRRRGLRVDRDELGVGARERSRADREHAIVRAHERVATAGFRPIAERGFAPIEAFRQGARGDHEVVECEHHRERPSVTSPRMQSALCPPTQTWPSIRSMNSRPLRCRQLPCATT